MKLMRIRQPNCIPVAAALSLGHDLAEFGSPLATPLVTLSMADVSRGRTSLSGQIVNIDRFGNLITDIDVGLLPPNGQLVTVEVGSARMKGISACYADVPQGELLALAGSSGRLEISIRDGNAADELQMECERRITVRWTGQTS